jgi:branched-chain amino acid transport system substrate-binding protein
MHDHKETRDGAGRAKGGLSRRRFLAASAAAAAAPLTSTPGVWAAESENVIRLGFLSPRTGNLGVFGEGDGYLIDLCRKALKPGLTIGGKTYRVDLLDRDTQSDPTRAGQLTKSLITEEKVDFVLVTSTPEVVNPAADACEAAGVPCLSTVMPWEAWYFGRGAKPGEPSPFKWSFHFSFGGAQFVGCCLPEWSMIPTNKKIGVMFPNDADGNAVRGGLPAAFKKGGFTVVDPGPFEDGTTDYSAQIGVFVQEQCEIVMALVLPPDFATFWRQAAQQGLNKIVKICQVEKAGSSPTEIEVLGDLGYNLCTTAPWNPAFPYKSPITNLTSPELADGYEKTSGKQVTKQLGSSMAVFDAGIEALRAAANPLDKSALAKAISTLKTTTTVGLIDFNTGPIPHVVATTPLVGTQYQRAAVGSKRKLQQVVVEHSNDPNVPITGKLLPYSA